MSKNNKYDDRGGRHGSGGRGHGAGSSGSCRGTGGRGRGAGSSGSSRGTGGGRFDRDREREHQHVNSHTQRTFQSASVVYFNDVIHSRKKMLGFTDAKRFIDGAVEIENLEMLSTLTESSESIGLLKRACSLGCDDSKNDCGLNETVMKLLNHLGKCELSVGSAKHCTIQCFKAIYETPGLLQNLLAKLKGGKIEKVSALVWFLVAVCKSDDTARQKPIVSDFLHALSSSGEIEKSPALKALVTVLMPEQLKLEYNSKHSGNTQMELSSLEHVQAFEPQHNNDFPFDYRQIGILPTIEEMNSKYRTCGITSVFSRNDSKNVAAMLDRQFRLLREDMLGPMREELDTEMKLPRDKKKKIFQNPQVVDIDTSPRICFTLLIDVPMSLQGRLKGMKKGERQNFYEEAGRRILARESMLVFLDNKGSDSFVKAVGLVVKREKSEFAANEKCFRVGVSFSKDSLDLVLQQFISSEQVYGKSRKEGATMCFAFGKEVFQASSSYFSYEPILHRLQELDSIPFEEQIVDEIAATVAEENVHTIPPEIQNKLASDPSQLRAAEAAMREKVVLVQGPPGTGKTFVGVQIAQALIKELKNPRILCLCYTNHALDDFLLSLHEDGLPLDAIIRLGKSPKINDKLKDRCLNDLPEVAFNRVQSRSFAILKKKLESDKSDINKSKNALAIRWGAKSWDHVRIFFIEHDYSSYLNQLSLPTSSDPTFEISGKKNKSIKPNYFWQEWCQGKSRREIKAFPLQVDEDEGGLWRLSKLERLQKIAEWQQEWVAPRVRSLKSCIESFEKNDKQLAALRTEAKVGTAVSATVLGCTTTSAAKNNDLIAQIRPNVIIIEEAAEILEANVITAINQYAEKLIMIGDHKQLRPKLESYNLRVDSGKGINFDVSLFERLAKEGQFPIHTLQVQHRMRPEISAIIRKNTYPDLVDHESVLHRDSIRGMDENCNVLFLNHDQKESYDEQAAMLGTSSKVNQHEADLAVAIVKYYLWQGYTESDLVILTPYLGQLMQIRNALKQQELDVSLSDLDRNDMKKLDLEETNTSNNSNKKSIKDESSVTEASDKSSCVRAATVDNFQGEEAKIVIISLVRCNDDKDIGFVNGAERINVMLSRARDGMCIIGSRNTFENASSSKGRQLWRKIFSHFDEHGLVYNSFPAQCYNHKVSTPSIYCSEDFTKMVPHGGCLQTCGFVLPTCPLKHTCTLRCHPLILARDMINSVNQDISTVVHKKMNCKEIVQERCANTINADLKDAHYVERVCSEKNVPLCRVLVPSKCVAGHYLRVECYRSGQSLSVKSCDYCKQLLKNAEIRRKQQREEEDRYRKELENIENEISLNKELLEQEKNREVQRIALARAKREKILLDRKLSADIERRKDLPIEDTTFDFTEDDFELLKPSSPATANSTIDTKNRLAHNAAEVGESNSSFAAGGGVVSSLSADVSQPRIESASNTTVLSSKAYTTDSVARSIHSTDSSQIKASSKSIIKEMITMAEKNSWLALHDKVEAMEKDTSFDRVILRLFSLLISINLGEMLQEEAEYFMTKLSKNRMTSSDIDNLKFILTLYINFKIAATNLRYLETAINYGERFLKIAENSERYKCFTVSLPPHWRTEVEEKCNELKSLNSKPTTPGTSSAADEWKRCKLLITSDSSSKSSVEAIDEMMKLTGLETVKRDFLNEYERICIAKERGESGALASYNTVLIGNPGTGKTTVARLYSKFLIASGILPAKSILKETTGSTLINSGVSGLKKMLEEAKTAGGGVIFVDEAYQLNPDKDQAGRQVLDFLLVHAEKMEGDYGKLVWLFAGYKKEMEKLLEHNPGLLSRFPNKFVFEDYTDEELLDIFLNLLQEQAATTSKKIKFTVSEPKWARIAIRRLGNQRGKSGFGNARAVRGLFDATKKRQSERIVNERKNQKYPDIFEFVRNDLLGPKASRETIESSSSWQSLQAMEGLKEVKEAMQQLVELIIQNAEREDAERPVHQVALNRIFLGNPGTGKTTVAGLYARILAELGLLSKGDVILKNGSDFVGDVLGSSESTTRSIIAQAEGSVLVIDEAYTLNPSIGSGKGSLDPYRSAVIDTIVEQVQGRPGEDQAVLLLGYRKEMEAMLADANPGLSRRFQLENAFEFKDYSDEELLRILLQKCKKESVGIDMKTARFAIKQLAKAKAQQNFGNAGAINNLLSQAKLNMQSRNRKSKKAKDQFAKEDFCPYGKLPDEGKEEEIFSDLVGCDEIKEKLTEYRDTIDLAKSQGKNPKDKIEYNFLFVGPPGVGKTTVARKMGKLFFSLGLLPTSDVVETTAAEFSTGYVGQAGSKTSDILMKARGKVLFIDEAYQLNPAKGGSFMQEVVDAIVQGITSVDLKDQLVIILAGYEQDIDEMLKANKGLKSRFSEKMVFLDFDVNTIGELLTREIVKECNNGENLNEDILKSMPEIATRLKSAPDFGNGRDVNTLVKRVYREFAKSKSESVSLEVINRALEGFLDSKKSVEQSNLPSSCNTTKPQHFAQASDSFIAPSISTATKKVVQEEKIDEEVEHTNQESSDLNKNKFLQLLQDILDERGLNSKEGVQTLSSLTVDSAEFHELAQEISNKLGIPLQNAIDMIIGWQEEQANVYEKLEEQEREMEKAKQEKRKAKVPIWRCGVCGRADKPYIACYVRPFIVRYEETEI